MNLNRLNISIMNRSNITIFIGVALLLTMLFFIAQLSTKALEFSSNVDSIKSEQAEIIEAIRLESINDIQFRMGQEIYIPAYSTLKSGDNEEIDFSITLSVRNTDPNNTIIVKSVDFYRSDGERFKRFIRDPLTIRPMATEDFIVSRADKFGGSGANFYVVWVSDTLVTEPVVEAIMLGRGLHAYSWVSSGKVVKSR